MNIPLTEFHFFVSIPSSKRVSFVFLGQRLALLEERLVTAPVSRHFALESLQTLRGHLLSLRGDTEGQRWNLCYSSKTAVTWRKAESEVWSTGKWEDGKTSSEPNRQIHKTKETKVKTRQESLLYSQANIRGSSHFGSSLMNKSEYNYYYSRWPDWDHLRVYHKLTCVPLSVKFS